MNTSSLNICVITEDDFLYSKISEEPIFASYKVFRIDSIEKIFDLISKNNGLEFIDLIVYDLRKDLEENLKKLKSIKNDPFFTTSLVLILLPCQENEMFLFDLVKKYPIDDYFCIEDLNFEYKYLIKFLLNIEKAKRLISVHPLTRLSSGITIHNEIQERLNRKEPFALAYADLDNFKAYNDVYGFNKGDEIIKFTGKIILQTVRQHQTLGSFVGHIGGDDFVYVCNIDKVETITKEIIEKFEQNIASFYNETDIQNGYITATNRQGKIQKFPLMRISIGIVVNKNAKFTHFAQMCEEASKIKKYVKENKEIKYLIDRRK